MQYNVLKIPAQLEKKQCEWITAWCRQELGISLLAVVESRKALFWGLWVGNGDGGCRDNESCGEKKQGALIPQVEISALSTELRSKNSGLV